MICQLNEFWILVILVELDKVKKQGHHTSAQTMMDDKSSF